MFQNLSRMIIQGLPETQVENIFTWWQSYVPFSRYSNFCILKDLMIYQICDVMMGISASEGVLS